MNVCTCWITNQISAMDERLDAFKTLTVISTCLSESKNSLLSLGHAFLSFS